MKITNRTGIIPALAACVAHDDYEKGDSTDYSVTELLAPARQRTLLERHDKELKIDVADMIYAFMGKIGHTILERAKIEGDVAEHRVSAKIDGFTIAGKFDRLVQGNILIDLKVMSVWEIIYGLREDKKWQLNMYRWLAAANGIKVDKLMIVGVLRDWSVGEAERRARANDTSYPKHQVVQIEVPIIDDEQVFDFMRLRISAHERARNTPNWLPDCTPEERWETPTKYALMKEGRKSALRVMEDEAELHKWAVDNFFADWVKEQSINQIKFRPKVYVERRIGQSVRCSRYCNALDVCTQGKNITATYDAVTQTNAA